MEQYPFSKVVIVDDNRNTVKSLQKSIDWASLGIELAGAAYDGIRGFDLIVQTQPDIIITDIRMPGLDGLSMIEQLQKVVSNSYIIVVTGYDEFQYASRAIKLSVFDYILKPIDNQELLNAVNRAVDSIREKRQLNVRLEQMNEFSLRALLLSLIKSASLDDHTIKSMLRDYGIDDFDCFYFVAIRTPDPFIPQPLLRRIDSEIVKNSRQISLVEGRDLMLFVMSERYDQWRGDAENLSRRLLKLTPDLTVVVSRVHRSAESVYEAFREVKQMLLEHSLDDTGGNSLLFCDHEDRRSARLSDLEQACDQLAGSELAGEDRLEEAYRTILQITGGEIRLLRTMLILYCTKVLNKSLLRSQWKDAIDATIYELSNIVHPEEAYRSLQRFYTELQNSIRMSIGMSRLVQSVLQYISLHATQRLRLDDVAAYFHVSPNHLSTLIRKETGTTYQQHMLTAKLNVAKKMLDDTRMSAEEISYAVGYENYYSFYHAFKRTEGVSPTDYRYRMLRGREVTDDKSFPPIVQNEAENLVRDDSGAHPVVHYDNHDQSDDTTNRGGK